MSYRAKSSSKSMTFQPMPVAHLIANLKTLPAQLSRPDSSDSDDSTSSVVSTSQETDPEHSKSYTPLPRNGLALDNKENVHSKRSLFDRAIFPSAIKITKCSETEGKGGYVRTPLVEKESARSLFLKPAKEPPHKAYSKTGPSNSQDHIDSPDDSTSSHVSSSKTIDSVQSQKVTNNVNVHKKRSLLDIVHVMPTITASITNSQAIESLPKHTSVVEKKESARCLFPEPVMEPPPKETPNQAAPKETPRKEETPCPKQLLIESSCSKSTQLSVIGVTPSLPQGAPNNRKVQLKTINVKGKKYMVMKKLGVGGSGEVFKVLEINSSNEFAVKCVNLATDREMARGYLNEVRVLRELQKSDRVVKLYDYEHDKTRNTLRLLIEVGETDLACFMRINSVGAPPALVLHYWEEMLRAVQQIHNHGIVHADLKPANFLLVSGRLKLIDFGIASAVSGDATSVVRSCGKGTFSYISPEALGGDGSQPIKVSFYSDVWSLGCILYSLIYGKTPFAHLSTMAKLVTIRDPNHTIGYPAADSIPQSLIVAAKNCLQYKAHSRPTVSELLKINHLTANTQGLPDTLLNKLEKHVTKSEMELLENARVQMS